MKKRHMDFVLSEDEYDKTVFRFYPKASHMHGFDENPPASLDDVYKVYYSWGVIQYSKLDDGSWDSGNRIFFMDWDECSALEYLGHVIRRVLRYKKRVIQIRSMGQPGSEWTITFRPEWVWDDENLELRLDTSRGTLIFEVFDNFTNLGYRFRLDTDRATKFTEYLDNVNQHMLENGEPI